MKYLLIKGSYYVVGQSPDGDSVKFRADNPALWQNIDTENRAVFEAALAENGGLVTLRLQGVDALETHYSPPRPQTPDDVKGKTSPLLKEPARSNYKQPAAVGREATDQLLRLLGVTSSRWRNTPRGSYITEAQIGGAAVKEEGKEKLPGFIVTGDAERNGRPIAWVFPGTSSIPDGSIVTNEQLAGMAELSANYQLLKMGIIYPLYYMTLAGKLRQKLDAAVQQAQSAARQPAADGSVTNIWRIDRSMSGFDLGNLSAVIEEVVIYPELFRRILRFYCAQEMQTYWGLLRTNAPAPSNPAPYSLNGFFNGANPYVFVVGDQDFVRLSDVVEIKGSSIRMKKSPHELVFLS